MLLPNIDILNDNILLRTLQLSLYVCHIFDVIHHITSFVCYYGVNIINISKEIKQNIGKKAEQG